MLVFLNLFTYLFTNFLFALLNVNVYIHQFISTFYINSISYQEKDAVSNKRVFNLPVSGLSYCHSLSRWLSGRVSDSGARGRGFETYRRRVVSLSKTLYSPKVLVNYPGSGGSVPT